MDRYVVGDAFLGRSKWFAFGRATMKSSKRLLRVND